MTSSSADPQVAQQLQTRSRFRHLKCKPGDGGHNARIESSAASDVGCGPECDGRCGPQILEIEMAKEVRAMGEQLNGDRGTESEEHAKNKENRETSSRSYGRRALMLGAATAGPGAAASLVATAEPAAAADGSAVLLGKSNKASATTNISTKPVTASRARPPLLEVAAYTAMTRAAAAGTAHTASQPTAPASTAASPVTRAAITPSRASTRAQVREEEPVSQVAPPTEQGSSARQPTASGSLAFTTQDPEAQSQVSTTQEIAAVTASTEARATAPGSTAPLPAASAPTEVPPMEGE